MAAAARRRVRALAGEAHVTLVVFIVAAALSLAASAVLVTRLERLGERLGAPEAILGLAAALAADSPEIATAIAAVARGQRDIGVGVVLGSNVFNLAALLGLSAVIAGRIALHRRVVLLEGAVAVWIALMALLTVTRVTAPGLGLALSLVAFVPYVVVSAVPPRDRVRLPLPGPARRWLAEAVDEEEAELLAAIHPPRGRWSDAAIAGAALAVVVAASAVMESRGSMIGTQFGLASIVVGGILLAAVTSLPNAVAAVYLARRGRSSATLSEALNSNALNAMVGFMIPAVVVGVGRETGGGLLTAWWYAGLTLVTLGFAYVGSGLGRRAGAVVITLYLVFVVVLIRL